MGEWSEQVRGRPPHRETAEAEGAVEESPRGTKRSVAMPLSAGLQGCHWLACCRLGGNLPSSAGVVDALRAVQGLLDAEQW